MDTPPKLRTIIKRQEFRVALGNVSRTSFWRLETTDPGFPKAVQISPHVDGFYLDEAAHYIESRQRKRERKTSSDNIASKLNDRRELKPGRAQP